MAKLFNRAKMTTSTTGSGTVTLDSASVGYQSFADAGVSNGDVVQYVIEEGGNFEIGTGTYSATGTSLTRSPTESSNSNAAISLGGAATVSITAVADDLNRLQHEGSTKVEPSATGATVTGNLAVTGTVNGRDVAADGTKLDGIESGATADQTAAEIRSLVESATDSNVFTDADHTKLNGIEANATADQTASEIRALVESASDSNVFTDADHTKLNGIESGATGDQSASEILTAIKTVDGSGSGLDADTLDGSHASAFLTGNQTITLTGDASGSGTTSINVTVANDSHTHDGRYYTETEADSRFVNVTGDTMSGTLTLSGDNERLKIASTTSTNSPYFAFYQGSTRRGYMQYVNGGQVRIASDVHGSRLDIGNGATGLQFTDGTTWSVFHDGYHPNADKWTTARTLSLSGDASGSVSWDGSANATLSVTVADDSHNHTWDNIDGGSVNSWGGLRHTTSNGYIDFGPANSSYAHIYTDRGSFYFNKELRVNNYLLWNAGNDGSGSGLDADLLDGQHGSYYYPASNPNGYTTNVGDITGVTAGSGLTGGGTSGAVTISHADTSNQASVNNSGRTYIQDITLDTYGHITGITSATETVVNTNTTYSAGTGLDLSGTTFSIESDLRGDVSLMGYSTSHYIQSTNTKVAFYFSGLEEFRFDSGGNLHADGNIVTNSTTTSSDERLKDNIKVVDNALDKLHQLRGVTFDWKRDGQSSAGVIAQDVMKVMPEAVLSVEGLKNKESHLTVNYSALTSILIEAIKEQQKQIEELKKQLNG